MIRSLSLFALLSCVVACGGTSASTSPPTQDSTGRGANEAPAEPSPAEPVVRACGARLTETRTGLVVSVSTKGGAHVLRVDYVDFLTGDEAAEAASLHGDESPPPNDYYVENDDRAVHELPIRPDAEVRVVIAEDGTSMPEGRPMSLTAWVGSLSGPHARLFEANVYRLELVGGVVTRLEQVYVP